MPTYGPWITPAPVSDTAPLPIQAVVLHRRTSTSTTSFAAACEGDTISGDGDLALFDINPGTTPYIVRQVSMAASIDDLPGFFADVIPPALPPGASGWEFDPADPASLGWLTGTVTVTMTLARTWIGDDSVDNADWPVSMRLVDPTTYTASDPSWPAGYTFPTPPPVLPQPPDQLLPFYPGASLAAMPTVGHVSPPLVGTPVLASTQFDGQVTLPVTDFVEVAGRRWAAFVLHFDGQVTHTHPVNTGVSVNVINTTTPGIDESFEGVSTVVAYTYQPRRYRAIYPDRPPLAHRQRRDGTATAGPQLAHIGTTGGRPPLAWRQNTP